MVLVLLEFEIILLLERDRKRPYQWIIHPVFLWFVYSNTTRSEAQNLCQKLIGFAPTDSLVDIAKEKSAHFLLMGGDKCVDRFL